MLVDAVLSHLVMQKLILMNSLILPKRIHSCLFSPWYFLAITVV